MVVSPSPKLASQLLNRDRSRGSSGVAAASGTTVEASLAVSAGEGPAEIDLVIPHHLCKGLHAARALAFPLFKDDAANFGVFGQLARNATALAKPKEFNRLDGHAQKPI
jgi:hypothetical protein